jgi:hypothetical protein
MGEGLTLSRAVDLVVYVIQTLINLAYIVGIGMIIYSGVKMAMSRGDQKKFSDAKNMLLYAIIGLAVMFAAGLIVNTLARFGQSPSSVIY